MRIGFDFLFKNSYYILTYHFAVLMLEKSEQKLQTPTTDRKIVVITVKNNAGVLSRVTSLLRRRTFNIDSLTVAKTESSEISRITLQLEPNVNSGQVAKQLEKLIDVINVFDVTHKTDILNETLFMRVYVSGEKQKDVLKTAETFNVTVIDHVATNIVFKLSGHPDRLHEFIDVLKGFGKHEVIRSGPMAIYL